MGFLSLISLTPRFPFSHSSGHAEAVFVAQTLCAPCRSLPSQCSQFGCVPWVVCAGGAQAELSRCRKEGMSIPEEFGMREAPSPCRAALVLLSPRVGALLRPVRFSFCRFSSLQLYSPEVSPSWDVSGEGTKHLLGSCFAFFREKKGFEEPRAPHVGTQLCHIGCQACASPAPTARGESQDG